MITMIRSAALTVSLLILFMFSCTDKPVPVEELKHYPADSLDHIISKTGVEVDRDVSIDGNGSFKVSATGPTTVHLNETGDIDVENARLIYGAKIRTEGFDGQVYLEMWCHFPGKGEFFSRALKSPLSGTNDWTSQETMFLLKEGENPDNVKLNLVLNGTGTAWIDNIRLMSGPLK